MKHTLEEIEELTKNPGIGYEHVGRRITISQEMVSRLLEVTEIISGLVEEVKRQRKIVHVQSVQITNLNEENKELKDTISKLNRTIGEMKEDFIITKILQEEAKGHRKENLRLREALQEISKDTFGFGYTGDEQDWLDHCIETARKALEG